jgi:hypothetical protein
MSDRVRAAALEACAHVLARDGIRSWIEHGAAALRIARDEARGEEERERAAAAALVAAETIAAALKKDRDVLRFVAVEALTPLAAQVIAARLSGNAEAAHAS